MEEINIGIDPRILEKEFGDPIIITIGKLFVIFFVMIFALFLINLNIAWLLRNRGA